MNTNVIIDAGCTQIWPGEAVIKRSFRTDATTSHGTFHEDAVTHKEVIEFLQHLRVLGKKLFKLCKGCIAEVAFETTNATNVGGKA